MSRPSKSLLLEEEIGLLIRHFGLARVQTAVARFSTQNDGDPRIPQRKTPSSNPRPTQPSISNALELIRGREPEKYRLLSQFLDKLKARKTLPESEDIRQFAQLTGLKDIQGKSRKDMIPTLMRFLIDRNTERLRVDIQNADNISQQQRQEGYSVLTDKLLGERR